MQIIDKKFSRANDNTIYIPKNVENDFVIFESGAKCKLSTFFTDFTEVTGNVINEAAKITDDEVIDPEKFLNMPIANDALLDQMNQAMKNPTAVSSSEKLRNSVDAGSGKNVTDFSEVKSVNKPIEMKETPIDILKKNSQIQNNLTERISDNPTTDAPTQQAPSNRLPEWDMFDRVKKSETVTLNLPITIQLPKAQRIEALNDMFETSFIAYIAKEYIQNSLTGKSKAFQMAIQDQIENWMNDNIDNSSRSKKKAKQVKSKIKEVEKTETTQGETSTPANEMSASDLLNKGVNPVKWNGNLGTLQGIQNEEQYDAVVAKMKDLKEDDKTDSKEFERLQDMVVEYKIATGK